MGFDGCSAMAGKDNTVQQFIRNEYSNATYFHCSSHKLNFFNNDLNSVQMAWKSGGVIKKVIFSFQIVQKGKQWFLASRCFARSGGQQNRNRLSFYMKNVFLSQQHYKLYQQMKTLMPKQSQKLNNCYTQYPHPSSLFIIIGTSGNLMHYFEFKKMPRLTFFVTAPLVTGM